MRVIAHKRSRGVEEGEVIGRAPLVGFYLK